MYQFLSKKMAFKTSGSTLKIRAGRVSGNMFVFSSTLSPSCL
jgi:hypothetical protein